MALGVVIVGCLEASGVTFRVVVIGRMEASGVTFRVVIVGGLELSVALGVVILPEIVVHDVTLH
ncbi:MAG: hypothetical protein ACR2I5_07705 [Candidatus Limnocylindria bacterium]